ncbi:MAG TPA: hypothetical protein PKE26_10435 [Kiritimatiellia bacterium]|nr:hypothetical protein [Kiritimatiellia bacterium]HMO99514.1 hypothetical protein [Kiritimatiellia bacterium]HMP91023.1 hypothetical protein [Kiritimatiellia bacterium]
MKHTGLLTGIFLATQLLVYGAGDHWNHIQRLVKEYDTPQGNPQLETYLKSLTPDQMLQAAREYSQYAANKFPTDNWAEAVMDVGLTLTFYGTDQGGLANDRLRVLLKCIADKNENDFFREALVRLVRQRYWEQMTDDQRRQSRQTFLEVLSDKNAPGRLRVLSCRELTQALAENHRRVIVSDKNIRPLRSDRQKWQNVNGLVRDGEIRLEPETRNALKAINEEIAAITPALARLSQDDAETPEVKEQAQSALKAFADLPVAPEQ